MEGFSRDTYVKRERGGASRSEFAVTQGWSLVALLLLLLLLLLVRGAGERRW